MTVARPIVAVIPFGARGTTPRAGAWARQLAARLVERFAQDESVDVRPVFLVAMPEAASEAGDLVFGSSPEPGPAAGYGPPARRAAPTRRSGARWSVISRR